MSIFLMLVLAGSLSGHNIRAQPFEVIPSVNEFDIDIELNLYNNMISCLSTFKMQFVQCNKQLQNLGMHAGKWAKSIFMYKYACSLAKNVFNWINENSTVGGMIKCCGVWMARDCWLRHAQERCIDAHIQEIHDILPFKLLPKLDRWCSIYHDQTFVCKLPYYMPIAFLLLSVSGTVLVLVWVAFSLRLAKVKREQQAALASQQAGARAKAGDEAGASQVLLDRNQNVRANE